MFVCCFLRRNPIVAIGYMILVWGGFILFVVVGYPKFPNPYVPEWHKPIGYFVMGLCIVSFLLAALSDPGIVTKENVNTYLEVYGNDGVVYKGGRLCETCGIEKPARSKHDKSLGKCVAKFDHYCIWLHNAVGERNYRWFLMFLTSHCWMLLYCAWAVSMHFRHEIETKQLLTQTFRHRASGRVIKGSWTVVFRYFMYTEQELMMILVLCGVMGVVVTLFLLYHAYLASHNLTTNETIKIGYLRWLREDAKQRKERSLELRGEVGAQLVEAEAKLRELEREVAREQGKHAEGDGDPSQGQSQEEQGEGEAAQRLRAMRDVVDRLKGMLSAQTDPLPPRPHVLWSGSMWANWRDALLPRVWYAKRDKNIRYRGPLRSRAQADRGVLQATGRDPEGTSGGAGNGSGGGAVGA